jgi:hypothetical protein
MRRCSPRQLQRRQQCRRCHSQQSRLQPRQLRGLSSCPRKRRQLPDSLLQKPRQSQNTAGSSAVVPAGLPQKMTKPVALKQQRPGKGAERAAAGAAKRKPVCLNPAAAAAAPTSQPLTAATGRSTARSEAAAAPTKNLATGAGSAVDAAVSVLMLTTEILQSQCSFDSIECQA